MSNNHKILGFMTIHYGGSYLREALLSVRDHVDTMVVAYSRKPSQGHTTQMTCPDMPWDIHAICHIILGDKLIWVEEDSYPSEAHHRDVKYKYAKGYDAILTVDADEVMLDIPRALAYAFSQPERHFGINGYYNFFRSFDWYCSDGFRPVRIEVLNRNNQQQNLECPMDILHFSLAQPRTLLEYKFNSFGHASEIRPRYLEEIWDKWTPESGVEWLHPVSLQIWRTAQFFNKNIMPDYLQEHPNFNLTLIS
jgi:hypothetical protein